MPRSNVSWSSTGVCRIRSSNGANATLALAYRGGEIEVWMEGTVNNVVLDEESERCLHGLLGDPRSWPVKDVAHA